MPGVLTMISSPGSASISTRRITVISSESLRNRIPFPKIENRLIGWTVFVIAIVILYDSYDGVGRSKSWPASAILPF